MPRVSNRSPYTGAQLRTLRLAAELTSTQLGRLMHCPPMTVLNAEAGQPVSTLYVRLLVLVTDPAIRQLIPLAEERAAALAVHIENTC